jgi:hypothetical protein
MAFTVLQLESSLMWDARGEPSPHRPHMAKKHLQESRWRVKMHRRQESEFGADVDAVVVAIVWHVCDRECVHCFVCVCVYAIVPVLCGRLPI